MVTRDGVRLDADIYRPDSAGEFPVLLMRQPYGKAIASTVVYAHPTWYAAQGYIVVIQDVRGRGTSDGKFDLFAHEVEDGFDSVNWAATLPGSTGDVGMYGFSYQGMTQLYAAASYPSALKTICPAMIGYDLYSDWAYEGGAFCLQANLGWAIQLATETARLQGDQQAYQLLYAASRNLPLYDPIPARPQILQDLAPDSFYHDWLDHPHPDEYWEKLSPKGMMQDVDMPMLHIGGWFDPFLRGTLHLYKDMASHGCSPQHLIIGPWAHLPWGRKVGAVDYGPQANSPVDGLQVRWFDQFLKGIDTKVVEQPPVCLFEMGTNRWRYFDSWPDGNQKSYYLVTSGLASVREDSGKLVPEESQEMQQLSETEGVYQIQHTCDVSCDLLVHDPWRPVPAMGGHAGMPVGSCDRTAIDCRTDVLTYSSPPLAEDLHIVGDVVFEVFSTADTPSFDICAVLSEVHPDGRVTHVTQGYRRVNPGDNTTNPWRIRFQATCVRIAQGNQLRLSLSGACFPAYPVNSGTGALPGESRLMDAQIITLKVSCGEDYPTRVLLPIFRSDAQ
ncbi:CocE/NonD family hydrolase [Moorena producens]|uniref:CocE/NonD family hydrolase n=1 Tax=Moorena producens TaxID=1155739 RepID=UPI003C76A122